MSGRKKSLAESHGDIGNYFSVSKNGTYLESEGNTTGEKISADSPLPSDPKALTLKPKQKTGSISSISSKRPRAPSNSPTEQRKRKNNGASQVNPKNKRMSIPSNKTSANNNTTSSTGQNEFVELEKRLLAGFEFMKQKEIEPLKRDIKDMKKEQTLNVNSLTVGNSKAITRKFQQNEEKHKKLQDRISYLENQLLEKNIIFQGIYETEFEDYQEVKTQVVK